ncbi:major royal jelly protein 1-like [Cloeon dipterum]|uniref:major royal jelly protein 1-like n=1 Tax=Cloeon dipterum TaxID=197152 RepID=UPI00321FA357
MDRFLLTTLLLSLPFAHTSTIYEWDEFDFNWPSEQSKQKYFKGGGKFEPDDLRPNFLAVYEERIFLSLYQRWSAPSTLVSFPTAITSGPAPPKLTPYPSLEMNEKGNCRVIQWAQGLQVDALGRLWVLDSGFNCPSKIWIFNLVHGDSIELSYQFNQSLELYDIALEKTQEDDWLAYITHESESKCLIVFSLNNRRSKTVCSEWKKFKAIAFSSLEKKLFFSQFDSKELYSISTEILKTTSSIKHPNRIVSWQAVNCYRMLFDNSGVLYAAFLKQTYIETWNAQKLNKNRFFLNGGDYLARTPFTFALDTSGIMWIMVYKTWKPSRHKLLRIPIGDNSFSTNASQVCRNGGICVSPTIPTAPARTTIFGTDKNPELSAHGVNDTYCDNKPLLFLNIVLSCWNVFSLFSIASQILWFRKIKKTQDSIAEIKKAERRDATNRASTDSPDPIYEEIESFPSTSALCETRY